MASSQAGHSRHPSVSSKGQNKVVVHVNKKSKKTHKAEAKDGFIPDTNMHFHSCIKRIELVSWFYYPMLYVSMTFLPLNLKCVMKFRVTYTLIVYHYVLYAVKVNVSKLAVTLKSSRTLENMFLGLQKRWVIFLWYKNIPVIAVSTSIGTL